MIPQSKARFSSEKVFGWRSTAAAILKSSSREVGRNGGEEEEETCVYSGSKLLPTTATTPSFPPLPSLSWHISKREKNRKLEGWRGRWLLRPLLLPFSSFYRTTNGGRGRGASSSSSLFPRQHTSESLSAERERAREASSRTRPFSTTFLWTSDGEI